ncbi:MAG: hypothetical protein JF627_03625 [Alphaproteobacteria bacterium]|nr:hypothetical protein [Alphaproteobacteria bacterium]
MSALRPFCALLVLGGAALAQDTRPPPAAPIENLTVTGIKDVEKAVSKFVESLTVPTRVAGKLARWKDGICPITVGLPPDSAARLTQRLKDIAAQAGMPVNPKQPCPGNIEIIFTAQPQALLDNVRIMHPVLLGYYDNSAQADKLATATRPIQSWYSTATVDARGNPIVDGGRKGGVHLSIALPPSGMPGPPDILEMYMPDAAVTNVTGNRLGDGVSSVLSNVMIVADTSKLLGRDIISVGDYIAMLALAQIQPSDTCQDMPSILNLLVAGCRQAGDSITSGDLAYLRALYKITATTTFAGQRREIQYQMNQALKAKE